MGISVRNYPAKIHIARGESQPSVNKERTMGCIIAVNVPESVYRPEFV